MSIGMLSRLLLAAGLVSLTLGACGNPEVAKIKAVLKERLKDPESAQFKTLVISDSGQEACVVWNAKNSMGGYADWKMAWVLNENSKWRVSNPDMANGLIFDCADPAFKIWVADREASQKREKLAVSQAEAQAYSTIKQAKGISLEEAVAIGKSKCAKLVDAIGSKSADIANPERKRYRQITEHRLSEYRTDLEKVNCDKYTEAYLNSLSLEDCLTEAKMSDSSVTESMCRTVFGQAK
jgi:hypothetical protein